MHIWQVQAVRDVVTWGGLVGLFLLGHRLSIVTVPLLLALLLAYLLEPVVRLLIRVPGIGRKGAAALLLVSTVLFVVIPAGIAASFAIVQGAHLASDLAGGVERVVASVQAPGDEELREAVGTGPWLEIRDFLVDLRAYAAEEPSARPEPGGREILGVDMRDGVRLLDALLLWIRTHAEGLAQQALETGRGALDLAVSAAGSLGRLVFGAFLTVFFFFFVCSGWEAVGDFARGLIPTRNRERALEIAHRMDRAVSGFVRGRFTIALVLAGFYALSFWLIGVPAPLLWGPAIAFLAIVPYAPVLGLPIVIVVLLLQPLEGFRGSTWWGVLAPLAVYQVGQALDDYVLTPAIQGESTGLSTPVLLFASIAGASLLGFYGLLVAIPLAACVKILVDEVFWPRFRAWSSGKEADFLPIDRDG
jgi:predicted PurR-regulated permease PerM